MVDKNKLYTIQEVATLLRFHPQTIYKMVRSGELKAIKLKKEWRIPGGDLAEYLHL